MIAVKHFAQVFLALFLSYGVWGAIGLNYWTSGLRQKILYYWYQAFFLAFLWLFFWVFLRLRKERAGKFLPLICFGLGAGYIASFLATCFWPLLASDGWQKFLHMAWDFPDLLLSGIILAGWISGVIMAGVLWLVKWGNFKYRVVALAVVMAFVILRLLFSPKPFMRNFLPLW